MIYRCARRPPPPANGHHPSQPCWNGCAALLRHRTHLPLWLPVVLTSATSTSQQTASSNKRRESLTRHTDSRSRADCRTRVAQGVARKPNSCDGSARRTAGSPRAQERGGSHYGVGRCAPADRPAMDSPTGWCRCRRSIRMVRLAAIARHTRRPSGQVAERTDPNGRYLAVPLQSANSSAEAFSPSPNS